MPAPDNSWLCRVCQHSNASAIEFCAGCGCPLAASEKEIAERLALREPLPPEPRSVSVKLIFGAAVAWLSVLVVVWLVKERISLSALGIWLVGVYLIRYLLLRWHGRPAQLGAASIDGELSSGWRVAIDTAVGVSLVVVVWLLIGASAPQ